MWSKTIRLVPLLFLLGTAGLRAQNAPGDVEVDVTLSEAVTKAQALTLSTLGVDARGKGQNVMQLIIRNRTNAVVSDLFLHIRVEVSGIGLVADAYSEPNYPFSLQPNQVVVGNNNNMDNGIPGIRETVVMASDITPEGEDFIESLEGATRLPDHVYTVTIEIYQGGNRYRNGRLLSSTTESIGSRPITNSVDFNIIAPGGPLGSDESLTSTQPPFRWEGPSNTPYRLILVEEPTGGGSPEALIQAALSTAPTQGGTSAGSLLENEYADLILNSTSYFYPASGVKRLQAGKRYYWQVFAQIRTATGVESRPSAVYTFTIRSPQNDQRQELQKELVPAISSLNPETAAKVLDLVNQGFSVDKMVVDGREISGAQLVAFFEEFLRKVERGEIVVVNR